MTRILIKSNEFIHEITQLSFTIFPPSPPLLDDMNRMDESTRHIVQHKRHKRHKRHYKSITNMKRRKQKQHRSGPCFTNIFSMVQVSILLVLTVLIIQPLATHGLLCTTLEEETLSAFHELLRTSSALILCPFTISGDGCDVETPFVYDSTMSRNLYVRCDLTAGGECKLSCEVDSHIVVKDYMRLNVYYMTFEKAKKGSILVKDGQLFGIGSTWRK